MPREDTTRATPALGILPWEKARVLRRFAHHRSAVLQKASSLSEPKATHDTNGTAGQTDDVVPDGPDQMGEHVAGQQSLQSGAVESGEKRAIQDFFPTSPLAGSGEVFQMLGLGMHDVEVG